MKARWSSGSIHTRATRRPMFTWVVFKSANQHSSKWIRIHAAYKQASIYLIFEKPRNKRNKYSNLSIHCHRPVNKVIYIGNDNGANKQSANDFLIIIRCNIVWVLHRFRDLLRRLIGRKSRNVVPILCWNASVIGDPVRISQTRLVRSKLARYRTNRRWKNFDDIFHCLDTIPECHRTARRRYNTSELLRCDITSRCLSRDHDSDADL